MLAEPAQSPLWPQLGPGLGLLTRKPRGDTNSLYRRKLRLYPVALGWRLEEAQAALRAGCGGLRETDELRGGGGAWRLEPSHTPHSTLVAEFQPPMPGPQGTGSSAPGRTHDKDEAPSQTEDRCPHPSGQSRPGWALPHTPHPRTQDHRILGSWSTRGQGGSDPNPGAAEGDLCLSSQWGWRRGSR